MLKVSFREPGTGRASQIISQAPPVVSEEVALLWILQEYEGRGAAVDVDWTADLATLKRQIEKIGVTDVTWGRV